MPELIVKVRLHEHERAAEDRRPCMRVPAIITDIVYARAPAAIDHIRDRRHLRPAGKTPSSSS
jgi:hypothetical protein